MKSRSFLVFTGLGLFLLAGCTATPHINGFLIPHGVDGYDWPSKSQVTIYIFATLGGGLLFTGNSTTDQTGHFYEDVGVNLIPGMEVEVNNGTNTKSVTLVPLTVAHIDLAGDTISGTSLGGARIFVQVFNGSKTANLWVTAGGNGLWKASFAGHFDVTGMTIVQVTSPGANGSGTVVKINPLNP